MPLKDVRAEILSPIEKLSKEMEELSKCVESVSDDDLAKIREHARQLTRLMHDALEDARRRDA
jgi:ElaB/YqjD/DUF883 family membrane-anchored ribosome-binding protein